MKIKNSRLEALRMIISSREMGSQEELLSALNKEGFTLTQATLSRDLKQLKVAKASTLGGQYIYVLPNETMYKRVSTASSIREMMQVPGFLSINFSGNMGVIKTRPGYASAIAFNIDRSDIPQILGTIAGDDTIFCALHAAEDAEDDYRILGIGRDASDEEVRKAYRRMAMKYHPDKVAHLGPEFQRDATVKFRRVHEAYERIKRARAAAK